MRIVGGTFTSVASPTEADAVVLVLGEPPDQPVGATWDLYVDVLLDDAGWSRLGAVRTRPVALRTAPHRVVAFAACPAARSWRASIGSTFANARAELFICGRPASGLAWMIGVWPNDPMYKATDGYTPDADFIQW